jgi:carbon catabolite-derepressing protein kinase
LLASLLLLLLPMDAMDSKSKWSNKKCKRLVGKYELGSLLGRGTFAKVYLARPVAGGEFVAVKVLDKAEVMGTAGMAPRVLREVTAMRRLRHPNVLRLHEVLATRSRIYLVMELAPGGDLLSKIAALPRRRLPEHAVRRVFGQLVAALSYCHARGVAHRDVKPQNVLLDGNGALKVSDFGLSALPDSLRDDGRLHTACGTPAYAAPEVLRRKAYDGAKADAWSCGVILFVLLAGHLPFDDANITDMCRRAHRREFQFPEWVSQPARSLVNRLLDPNPVTRVAVETLTTHPWFKRSLSLDSVAARWAAQRPAGARASVPGAGHERLRHHFDVVRPRSVWLVRPAEPTEEVHDDSIPGAYTGGARPRRREARVCCGR